MTHIEYLTELTDRLNELDGKTVDRAQGANQSSPSPSQNFDKAVEQALSRIIRKRASL